MSYSRIALLTNSVYTQKLSILPFSITGLSNVKPKTDDTPYCPVIFCDRSVCVHLSMGYSKWKLLKCPAISGVEIIHWDNIFGIVAFLHRVLSIVMIKITFKEHLILLLWVTHVRQRFKIVELLETFKKCPASTICSLSYWNEQKILFLLLRVTVKFMEVIFKQSTCSLMTL